MIEVINFSKTYGDFVAVENLSFSIGEGEIFGFIGPNGAGKSTTILCLVGLLRPDRGTVLVDGKDVQREPLEARRRIGYVPEIASVYEALTPREFLTLKGRLFSLPES